MVIISTAHFEPNNKFESEGKGFLTTQFFQFFFQQNWKKHHSFYCFGISEKSMIFPDFIRGMAFDLWSWEAER